ncbi:uncharacterized protein BP5553_01879 [Venustampulla echinocandica]|uniref:Uncharacterized protein n=1 Tax=Venustampulla echinocandica TaxID=2656787 RepID=A0A370U294_9HELO|nr:uncharacterized protein BP5553_01879 [Venustampulla echinocandica]RDL41900.1 hypothetical protein BP5553_01879 [Venustampulla echinocandica]
MSTDAQDAARDLGIPVTAVDDQARLGVQGPSPSPRRSTPPRQMRDWRAFGLAMASSQMPDARPAAGAPHAATATAPNRAVPQGQKHRRDTSTSTSSTRRHGRTPSWVGPWGERLAPGRNRAGPGWQAAEPDGGWRAGSTILPKSFTLK